MKRRLFALFGACALLLAFLLGVPVKAPAEVNVNINIPLPTLVFPGPPALVVIPGTYAYYPPDVDVEIFFYHGYWYRPYGGRWYLSVDYNGPWRFVAARRVPVVVRQVPEGYRRMPPGYERVPYGQVRRNWRGWEDERYWDHRGQGREYRGDEGRGEHEGRGRERGGMRRGRGED